MKLVYLNSDCGIPIFADKGACVHIQEMARAFSRQGCELKILTARRGTGDAGDLEPVTEVVAGPSRPTSMLARADKESLYQQAAEALEARLVELHKDFPFELIYERYSLWSAAGVRAARRLGVPCAVEVNAPLVEEQQAFRQLARADDARGIEREVFTTADMLFAVSEPLTRYIASHGASLLNVHVVPNAVDCTKFHPAVPASSIAGIADDAFVVGFVGSLKRWHGVDILMHAFAQLCRTCPRAHLLVVGDGPKRGWIEGFAAGAGLESSLTLTGWVDHGELPGLIARMNAVTAPYPARDDHYFSPLKLFEYMAMGRPVVASAIGQINAVLRHNQAGICVPPGDAPALAAALSELERDRDRADRLGAAAAKVGKSRDWSSNAKIVLDVAAAMAAAA